MPEASRTVAINIRTVGDPKGAQEVSRALDKIATTSEKIGIENQAFYDLDAQLQKTTPKVEELTRAKEKAATTSGNLGSKITQVGYQVQDFAVQVGSGTSALTALAQQGSQLLGMFGPGGAVAGALLAIGAIAVKVFSGMGDSEKIAKDNADALSAAIEAIRDNAKELSDEKINFSIEAIKAAKTQAEDLRDIYKQTNAAQAAAELASLGNAEKIRLAQVELDKLFAKRTTDLAEIKNQEQAASAIRAKQAQQQIDAANKRKEDAKNEAEAAQRALEGSQALALSSAQELETERAKLAALRDQAAAREKLRNQLMGGATGIGRASTNAFDAISPGPGMAGVVEAALPPEVKGQIEAAEGKIASLEKTLETTGSTTSNLVQAASDFALASAQYQDAANAIAIEIPAITQSLQTADIQGKTEALKTESERTVTALKSFVDKFDAITPVQKEAEANINKALEDGILTADEARSVSGSLKTLMGTIKLSNGETRDQVDSLIGIVNQLLTDLIRQKADIEGIKQRMGGVIR